MNLQGENRSQDDANLEDFQHVLVVFQCESHSARETRYTCSRRDRPLTASSWKRQLSLVKGIIGVHVSRPSSICVAVVPKSPTNEFCPNTRCWEELIRSVRIDAADDKTRLFCTACEKDYTVNKSPNQISEMTYEYGKHCAEERLISEDQIGIGDILGYERQECGKPYTHPVIVCDVNRKQRLVKTIEMVPGDERTIAKKQQSFSDIKDRKNIRILRFMPLDCLPVEDTLQRAWDAANKQNWQPQKYRAFSNHCQQFVSWCKVGGKQDEDAEKYEEYRNINLSGAVSSSSHGAPRGTIWQNEPSDGWSSEALQACAARAKKQNNGALCLRNNC